MARTIRTAVFVVALASTGNSLSTHGRTSRNPGNKDHALAYRPRAVVTQELGNHGDMQYTGVIRVGGQDINAIIDTGSFELLVFSTRCKMCGDTSALFEAKRSHTYHVGDLATEHSFGSGSTESTEAYDDVAIGDMVSQDQVFWQVVNAAMPVLEQASFQAILGVGPPQSAVDMAKEDEDTAREVYEGRGTDEALKDTKHFAEVVKHARNATSLLSGLGLRTYSFCLEKSAGSSGWFIWHDSPPAERPTDTFKTVPVLGDLYWSAELSQVKLGMTLGGGSANFDGVNLGCHDKPCSAVFDSGTSLISAPSRVVDMIEDILAKRPQPEGDCTDLRGLPELEFKIAGEWYSLPASSYVGEIEDVISSDLVGLMPHLRQKERRMGCVPVLMTLDADSQFGPLWVLGMPFFRKYYSTFHLASEPSARPEAKTMAFAAHDGHCHPKASSFMRLEPAEDAELYRPFHMDMSKVNVPSWLHAASKSGHIEI